MAKIVSKTVYQCQACGYQSPKWAGKCPDCGQWNCMVEERVSKKPSSAKGGLPGKSVPMPLSEIDIELGARTTTGIGEFDRVLGGGLVPGSVVLIGGDPGIGKSTLILQAAAGLEGKVLYVSGEESPEQIKIRAERLGIKGDNIILLSEIMLGNVLATASAMEPTALVVDSIQTTYSEEFDSAPGSVGQVRECAMRLMLFAKSSRVPVFIIGHVTKEGAIAGPRVLEHIVDTVLYFEGDKGHPYRILRTVKNRFGSTNEIGVFQMSDAGLSAIDNPSELFLSERREQAPGSVVVSSIEGTRPILVEIQALVAPTMFGMPRRTAIGMDFQRVNLLVAVLEKMASIAMSGMDIYMNVVGGLKLTEPAIDLAVLVAITSSLRERPVPPDIFVFGEVGLSGEVRAVGHAELRLREASRIGFKKAIIPAGNAARLKGAIGGLEVTGVATVREALDSIEF